MIYLPLWIWNRVKKTSFSVSLFLACQRKSFTQLKLSYDILWNTNIKWILTVLLTIFLIFYIFFLQQDFCFLSSELIIRVARRLASCNTTGVCLFKVNNGTTEQWNKSTLEQRWWKCLYCSHLTNFSHFLFSLLLLNK